MNRLLSAIILITLSCTLHSCSFYKLVKGKKKKHATAVADTTAMANTTLPQLPVKDTVVKAVAPDTSALVRQLINELMPVWQNRLVYNTFSGKAKVHVDGPDGNQDFTAHIRIRKDSVIWINITALGGLSFGRVLITRDSFFMINQLQKEYRRMPLSDIAKILPSKVDFASLQNLIVGEPLREGAITNAKVFGGSWTLQVDDSSYIQQITYNRADSTMRTEQMRTRTTGGPEAILQYGDYEMTAGRRLSTDRAINVKNGNDVYSVEMHFNNADFNQPLEFPFSIPRNYTLNNQ